jgi:hypothetical protein
VFGLKKNWWTIGCLLARMPSYRHPVAVMFSSPDESWEHQLRGYAVWAGVARLELPRICIRLEYTRTAAAGLRRRESVGNVLWTWVEFDPFGDHDFANPA